MSDELYEDELIELLINQLQLEEQQDDGFMTMYEIADAAGISINMAQIRMRRLHRLGLIEVRKVLRMNMAGALHTVPAYRAKRKGEA